MITFFGICLSVSGGVQADSPLLGRDPLCGTGGRDGRGGTNISFEQNGITTSPSGWNVWTSDSSDENTVRTEYGDAYDGDYKLTFWDDKEYSCSVYKTYTNIPNGTYKFSIWAKTNGKQNVLQLYAKNYGGSELDTTIETSDINWNIFSIDKIVVTNHTLEIGVYSVAGANDWCNLDLAMLRKID